MALMITNTCRGALQEGCEVLISNSHTINNRTRAPVRGTKTLQMFERYIMEALKLIYKGMMEMVSGSPLVKPGKQVPLLPHQV